jgi:hypothetical protein
MILLIREWPIPWDEPFSMDLLVIRVFNYCLSTFQSMEHAHSLSDAVQHSAKLSPA